MFDFRHIDLDVFVDVLLGVLVEAAELEPLRRKEKQLRGRLRKEGLRIYEDLRSCVGKKASKIVDIYEQFVIVCEFCFFFQDREEGVQILPAATVEDFARTIKAERPQVRQIRRELNVEPGDVYRVFKIHSIE